MPVVLPLLLVQLIAQLGQRGRDLQVAPGGSQSRVTEMRQVRHRRDAWPAADDLNATKLVRTASCLAKLPLL